MFYLSASLSSNRSCLVSKTQVSHRALGSIRIDPNTKSIPVESLCSWKIWSSPSFYFEFWKTRETCSVSHHENFKIHRTSRRLPSSDVSILKCQPGWHPRRDGVPLLQTIIEFGWWQRWFTTPERTEAKTAVKEDDKKQKDSNRIGRVLVYFMNSDSAWSQSLSNSWTRLLYHTTRIDTSNSILRYPPSNHSLGSSPSQCTAWLKWASDWDTNLYICPHVSVSCHTGTQKSRRLYLTEALDSAERLRGFWSSTENPQVSGGWLEHVQVLNFTYPNFVRTDVLWYIAEHLDHAGINLTLGNLEFYVFISDPD